MTASAKFGIYLGEEDQNMHSAFIAENDVYAVFTGEKDRESTIQTAFDTMQKAVENASGLREIETAVDEALLSFEGQKFSFSAVFVKGSVNYLITRGEGAVYVWQSGSLLKVIDGRKSASGYVSSQNMLIPVSARLALTLETAQISAEDPHDIVEDLKLQFKETDDKGMIGIFISFPPSQTVEPSVSFKEKMSSLSTAFIKQSASRSKKMTFALVCILFAVLVWSVVFGYERRAKAVRVKRIAAVQASIDAKLTEAQDLSSLNVDRSQELIQEAKKEVEDLRASFGDKEKEKIQSLQSIVDEKEKAIFNTANVKGDVFYDLSLIKKNAKASAMYLSDDTLVLLNGEDGEVYTLSVSKKSAATIDEKEFLGADKVGAYEDSIFVLSKNDGVYKIEDTKTTQPVKKDEKWKDIIDIALFNGNIYLLDRGADEVYKYLVAEEGYSGLTSYFKGGQADLASAQSFAIDSSVYIATQKSVLKYTSGIRDSFSMNLPNKGGVSFDDIFVSTDTSSVYILDRKAGKVYVVSKTGEYQKQLESGIFKQALDFVVIEKNEDPKKTGILVLTQAKLYRVPLD